MRRLRLAPVPLLSSLLVLSACSGGLADSSSDRSGAPTDGAADAGRQEPEGETVELRIGTPATTERHVFVADEDGDTVTVIEVETLRSTAVTVAALPRQVRAVPGEEKAVLLSGSLRAIQSLDMAESPPSVRTLPIPARCARLDMSPDGEHAVAWACGGVRGQDGTEQEVVVARLATSGVHTVSTAGPVESLTFSASGDRLLIVTDQGLHSVDLDDLTTDVVAATLPLPDGMEGGAEFSSSPDGAWVLARSTGADDPENAHVALLDVERSRWRDTPESLRGVARIRATTDTSTSWGVATAAGVLAVVRVTDGEVVVTPLGAPLEAVQSVRWDGELLVASGTDGGLPVVRIHTEDGDEQLIRLRLPVMDAVPSDDPRILVALHASRDTVSVIRRDLAYAKLEQLPGDVAQVVFTASEAPHVWLTTEDGSAMGTLIAIDVETLARTDTALGGEPLELGSLGRSASVFAAVAHPLGRLVFAGPEAGRVRVVTGFGLNAQVE